MRTAQTVVVGGDVEQRQIIAGELLGHARYRARGQIEQDETRTRIAHAAYRFQDFAGVGHQLFVQAELHAGRHTRETRLVDGHARAVDRPAPGFALVFALDTRLGIARVFVPADIAEIEGFEILLRGGNPRQRERRRAGEQTQQRAPP